MRSIRVVNIAAAGLLVAAAAAGCFDLADDCTEALDCPLGDGGPPAGCVPSMLTGAVADSCGVFVSVSGDDGNAGTKEKPLKTITAALGMGTTVYACAGAAPYSEAVTVPAGVALYGGLDGSSWKYVGAMTKTAITAGAGKIPVTLAMGLGAKLADLHVLAADVSTMTDGTSSIAVVANGATAELNGCVIEAQGAAAGAPGEGYTSAAMPGATGLPGTDACMGVAAVLGANPVNSGCGTSDSTSGGGGNGLVTTGGDGTHGSPGNTMNGGAGESASVCATGTKGDDGLPGIAGTGATAVQPGTVGASGYIGVPGTGGQPGPPGQGGGGGGGAKGGTGAGMCPVGMAAGATGGSGGSGGCGGAGGNGGNPGGSSLALVNLGATLTMSSVTLKAGSGGKGGDGGPGQNGGTGAMQGAGGKVLTATGLNPGCDGGPGGQGGAGGRGGGGRGGHAIGIAYTGTTAPSMTGATFAAGTPGMGGAGDDSMGNMGDGAVGVATNVQGF
jgi:hypothetical protein